MTTPQQARITLIGLTEEFDIKGKLSNKFYIYRNGEAVDIVGVLLDRLGYQGSGYEHCTGPNTPRTCAYTVARRVLDVPLSFDRIYQEIDRPASTNASIRAFIFKTFGMVDHNPEAVHPQASA